MRKLLLFVLLIFQLPALACLNIYGLDSNGKVHYHEHHFLNSLEFNKEAIVKNIKSLQKDFSKGQYYFRQVSDYGAYLLMAGRFKDGLDIFRQLILKHPGQYAIKANLAVAYELNGNLDSALYWERQAVTVNPYAHNHSEWIHLQLLEAKLNYAKDPAWLENNKVTHIADSLAKYDDGNEHPHKVDWIFKHFIHQLNERLPFTLGEDPEFAKLLFELGDAYMKYSVYRSYYAYAMASYFSPALTTRVHSKFADIKKIYQAKGITYNEAINFKDREIYPPSDKEVDAFLYKLKQRQQVYISNLPSLDIAAILSNMN